MTTATGTYRPQARPALAQPWLYSAKWDLTFLICSILIAGVPYAAYLLFGGAATDAASMKGTAAYNARMFVNTLVTFLVGGPHMYATFTRTVFDTEFLRKRRLFLASTIIVPVAVITMAVLSYETYVWLLSIFFAMASIHALYQIIWLTDAYNLKSKRILSLPARLIDYGVVLTSLYPIATYKMAAGEFKIGPVELKYNSVIHGWYWLAALAGLAFAVMLLLFVVKSVSEYRAGMLNLPKTLLISVSAMLMFLTPLFSNLDTAFQGINSWHSFQYLALVWYANHLREQQLGRPIGFMHWPAGTGSREPGFSGYLRRAGAAIAAGLRRIDRANSWTAFYLVCVAMLPVSGLFLAGAQLIWPNLHVGQPGADEVYTYIGVLSILLVHYVQDALLFTDARSLVGR